MIDRTYWTIIHSEDAVNWSGVDGEEFLDIECDLMWRTFQARKKLHPHCQFKVVRVTIAEEKNYEIV